jgi:competence protein ComEA
MRGFRTVGLVLAVLTFFSPLDAQDLPDAGEKKVFENACSACHGADIVIGMAGNRDFWQKSVDTMRARGALGTDDEFKQIVNYLARYFGVPVNVNQADSSDLTRELEITADEADAIVRYRVEKGKLKDWSDLAKVPGVGIKKLEPLKSRIRF